MNFSKKNNELKKNNRNFVSKANFTFIITLLITISTFAQQQGINYKALIKDASGNSLVNTLIRIQFNIQYEPQNFITVYSEEHVVSTDVNGIVIVNIGDGNQTSQDDGFLEIGWSDEEYYLNVEVDITGGTNYVNMGTTQFMAIPYTKHANTATHLIDNPWSTFGTIKTTTSRIVGVKTPNPEEALDVNGRIKLTDDVSNPTPTNPGVIRWNETTADFEGYNGSVWVSLTKNDNAGGWGSSSVSENQVSVASDGAVDDYLGFSVSISGDTAIVGAYRDDDNSNNSGSAYIFKRVGTIWTEQTKLTASDGAADDNFGFSVSISGDTAIVGAYGDGAASGSAYIFNRVGTTWTQQAKLTASDGVADDYFGSSVSISGDTAIVGAPGDDDNGNNSGSAYIFIRSGNFWSGQGKLTATDGSAYDSFGYSVSISGDTAIVGAYADSDNSFLSGSAYIFNRVGTVWTQQAKLTASDGVTEDYFGYSVSISGNTAIVGARGDIIYTGSAYIFNRVGTIWTEQTKLMASDAETSDSFGVSVSISGDTVIVGAGSDNDNGIRSGSAYIFNRVGTEWSQQAKFIASDGAAEDYFGSSVSISGDTTIIGAPNNDDNGGNSGSVYFFQK